MTSQTDRVPSDHRARPTIVSRRDRMLLRITALWTFFVWGVFVKNLLGDDEHSAGFKAVHVTLAVISVGLAVVVWKVSSRPTGPSRPDDLSR